jgi:hypothetical protein
LWLLQIIAVAGPKPLIGFGVSTICKNRWSAVARIEHAEFGQCTVTLVPFFTEAALLPFLCD